jgi:phage baseplate assembly protein W
MAINKRPVYQYAPINETPEVAVGIPLPFNKSSIAMTEHFRGSYFGDALNYASGSRGGGQVFAQTYTTEEQVLSNLKNLLMTFKGERYMQPNFGTRIREVLFDNNTPNLRSALETTIRKDINYWLPYIDLREVDMVSSDDRHSLTIRLHFRVTTTGANMVINILATENEFQVTDAEMDTGQRLTQVGDMTVGTNTAFDLGGSGGGFGVGY